MSASAFSPITVPPKNKKRRIGGAREGGASTNSEKMFGSMVPPAGRRPRSPTFSEGDGTEQTRTMLNLLTLRNNKDKAAMEFIRFKNLEKEFNEWYKNKP